MGSDSACFSKLVVLATHLGNRPIDFVDSLHYPYSSIILLAFFSVISFVQYFLKPIQCWVPQEHSPAWEQYVEESCWSSNTYYVPKSSESEIDQTEYNATYRWVPFVLIVQALLFCLPYQHWYGYTKWSSVPLSALTHAVQTASNATDYQQRQATVNYVAKYLLSCSKRKLVYTVSKLLGLGNVTFFLTLGYFGLKVLLFVEVFLQFALITYFTKSSYFGVDLLMEFFIGNYLRNTSPTFPKTVACLTEVHKIGKIHKFITQCTIGINVLNKNVFFFLWWWLLFLVSYTLSNTLIWLKRLVLPCERRAFVYSLLQNSAVTQTDNNHSLKLLHSFTDKVLGSDGVLILHLLASKSDLVIVSEIVNKMWLLHQQETAAQSLAPNVATPVLYGGTGSETLTGVA